MQSSTDSAESSSPASNSAIRTLWPATDLLLLLLIMTGACELVV